MLTADGETAVVSGAAEAAASAERAPASEGGEAKHRAEEKAGSPGEG